MNVLVYAGPEVQQTSLNHSLSSLKLILFPHYTVQPITQRALITQPWAATCALLVVPQCRARFLSSSASRPIQEYLEDGGAYLGLGTGALYSPRGLVTGFANLNLGISSGEDTRLRFFDKFNSSYIYPETGGGEGTPGLVQLRLPDGQALKRVFDAGIGKFIRFEDAKGVVALAHYADREGVAAGVAIDVSGGKIALWSPNIEYPLSEEPASSLLAQSTPPSEVESLEVGRRKLLKDTLIQLGLQIPEKEGKSIARPLPQFLTSTPTKPRIVSTIIQALSPSTSSQLEKFKDANDTFQFVSLADSSKLLEETRAIVFTPSDPSTWQPKHIVLCSNGELPSRELTPLFDLDLFFKSLAIAREQRDLTTDSEATSWGVGEALLYGEAITSTQTMLDKNPTLLTQLPTPLLSLASHQLAGRGRGNNVWLSPSGCLQFSILLRVSLASFPANKLVFIQYLFALAVVEACKEDNVLGKWGEGIRLKWPNDLYALVGEGEEKRKVGGVLVNTSFSGGNVDVVIGCGLNILNPPPITSISQLLPHGRKDSLSIENTAAAIMATFESMWSIFIQNRGSFEPFMDLYLERWLHSDQLVTLTTTTPHSLVRITGITPDHGLLRTMPERPTGGPRFFDLQPDGNSFDLMAGLIKSK